MKEYQKLERQKEDYMQKKKNDYQKETEEQKLEMDYELRRLELQSNLKSRTDRSEIVFTMRVRKHGLKHRICYFLMISDLYIYNARKFKLNFVNINSKSIST